MLIVGVSGSPRNQATEYVLGQALELLVQRGFETKLWTVRGKSIHYCMHCNYCLTHKVCIIKDDLQELYDLLTTAQGISIATPVYNGGISAQLKTVMDRTRAIVAANKTFFRGKIGMGITVGGDRAGGQELAQMQIHTFYLMNGMIPVSGGTFGANLGANLWSKDTLKGVKLDTEGMRGLKKTVKHFSQYLELYTKTQSDKHD
ncbi:flavodoxin family protein [Candidatus Bathycorpusculum sp.]|uniref:flavodoxin family protein n=1 Tax=Candidatus Bathycorpusculum sp. TaxID=2994959 RepID=UPI00282A3A60|nr:flavodoxin family protein [Candidatus Termitimicrobium sp.]